LIGPLSPYHLQTATLGWTTWLGPLTAERGPLTSGVAMWVQVAVCGSAKFASSCAGIGAKTTKLARRWRGEAIARTWLGSFGS